MTQTTQDWRASMKFYGASDKGTPYISDGDSARVLCFLNMSGAYDGFARLDEAKRDAARMAAAPRLLAALVAAERFIAGFEDDETQEGVADLLAKIRAAIGAAA